MSFQQLLAWLHVARPEESKVSEIADLVGAALDEIDEDHPNYDLLLDIEQELTEGRVPRELLHNLAEVNASPEPVHDVELLAEEYRQLAEKYTDQQWQSNYFLELSRHLDDSDDDSLLDFVDSLRNKLTEAWTKYSKDFTLVSAQSAEAHVGHQLMREAYENWMDALDLVEEGLPDDEVLQAAETAVRLLAAVKQLDSDVQRQAKSLSSNVTFRTGR